MSIFHNSLLEKWEATLSSTKLNLFYTHIFLKIKVILMYMQ